MDLEMEGVAELTVNRSPVLCLNSGSSSLKFALYSMGDQKEELLIEGEVDRIGLQNGHLNIRGSRKETLTSLSGNFPDHQEAVRAAFSAMEKLHLPVPAAVGHRVVHGGPDHTTPVIIDSQILNDLRKLIPFAPLHLPGEILCIESVATHFPELPQIACFDTAFHRSMPEIAERFPLPRYLWDEGVRRYGFHGLSYEYILSRLGAESKGRIIIAHLGNGASMAAVKNGRPQDTTMGFSPTGGFMMSTRSGDLDPGVLLYLMHEKGYDSRKIEDLVNHRAGLFGVSEISPDMKTLLDKMQENAHAAQAVDMFCYHLRKHIGALTALLGGIDMVIFTGGIGERAPEVRRRVCQGLKYLGIHLDDDLNERNAETISTLESQCKVRVIPTNEDLVIAMHTYKMVF
jgi:acetate kinase